LNVKLVGPSRNQVGFKRLTVNGTGICTQLQESNCRTYTVFHGELKSNECEIRYVTEDTRILLRNSDRGHNVKTIQGHFFRCP